MKYESPKYHLPSAARTWNEGVEKNGAGIFYLEGDCHFAARRSAAERHLFELGALLIATVRFDSAPHEAAHAGHTIRPIAAHEAAAQLRQPAARN